MLGELDFIALEGVDAVSVGVETVYRFFGDGIFIMALVGDRGGVKHFLGFE